MVKNECDDASYRRRQSDEPSDQNKSYLAAFVQVKNWLHLTDKLGQMADMFF